MGQALSLIGSALTQFVLIWWITDTTGSVSALATAGLMALLPQALLGPVGGAFADRYSRRVLMIAADVVSVLCMAVLIYLFASEQVALWHVYTMMFIRSAMQALQAPAAAASVAMLVPASFLPRAAGLNQTLYGIMTIAAAPLGALAISFMPIGYALGIDVLTALLGIVPLFLFRIPQPVRAAPHRHGIWGEFWQSVELVWNSPALVRLYALLAASVVIIMPTFTLVPLLVKSHFGGGAADVAIVEAAAGIGMVAGGLIVTALAPRRLVTWILLGFAFSSLTLGLFAATPGDLFWLAALLWGLSGLTFILGNAPLTTLIQTTVPNEIQGRVLALLGTIMALAAPIGLVLVTPLGELIGIRWLFVAMGIAGAIVSFAGFLSPVLMKLDQAYKSGAQN
jgi:DHA3 family macrolide efflux protein-like MFS transporter